MNLRNTTPWSVIGTVAVLFLFTGTTNAQRLVMLLGRDTGSMEVINSVSDPVDVDSYSVTSSSGLLNVERWNSLTDQGDVVVNDLLVSRGFNVTLVSQNEDATTTLEAADAADLVVVSESIGSGNVNTEIVESTSPILLYEAYLYDDFAWTGGTISNDFAVGDDSGNTPPEMTDSISIVQPDHPLAAGLPAGDVPVLHRTRTNRLGQRQLGSYRCGYLARRTGSGNDLRVRGRCLGPGWIRGSRQTDWYLSLRTDVDKQRADGRRIGTV